MARSFRFPKEWREDRRRSELATRLGGLMLADGAMVAAWELVEDPYIHSFGKHGIPQLLWVQNRMPQALLEMGLAELRAGEVWPAFTDKAWDWVFMQVMKGRASARKRKAKYGTSRPLSRERTGVHVDNAPLANRSSVDLRTTDEGICTDSSLVPSMSTIRSTSGASQTPSLNHGSEILRTGVQKGEPRIISGSVENSVIRVDNFGRGGERRGSHLGGLGFDGSAAWCLAPELELKTIPLVKSVRLVPALGSGSTGLHNIHFQSGIVNESADYSTIPIGLPKRGNESPDYLGEQEVEDLLAQWPLPKPAEQVHHKPWFWIWRACCSRLDRYLWSLAPRTPKPRDRARYLNNKRALQELRKNFNVAELAAALRWVERNCRRRPRHGVFCYLRDDGVILDVLQKLQQLQLDRDRRVALRAELRMRAEAYRFNCKIRAFTEAFGDRRARRRAIDELRALYPRIFLELPRAAFGEISVAAQLWAPEMPTPFFHAEGESSHVR